jgi:hypothetical protein
MVVLVTGAEVGNVEVSPGNSTIQMLTACETSEARVVFIGAMHELHAGPTDTAVGQKHASAPHDESAANKTEHGEHSLGAVRTGAGALQRPPKAATELALPSLLSDRKHE